MRKRVCRFCLKTSENFQAVQVITSYILDMLHLKINLAVSEEPVMCTNCAETLKNSFSFKAMCVGTHHYAVSFLNNRVDLSKKENILDIPEDQNVCAFCSSLVKECSAVSLDYKNENVMLEKCLPELDFSIINISIICGPCQESLRNCFHFMSDCLIVEEKIQKYCEVKGVNNEGIIDLSDVQEYTSNSMLSEEGSNTPDTVKDYKTFCEDGENADTEVKHTHGSVMEVDEGKLNSVQQFTSEMENKKCLIIEDIEIKTKQNDFDRLQGGASSLRPKVGIQLHRCNGSYPEQYLCDSCKDPSEKKCENPSEIAKYQCESCPFRTNHKSILLRHMLTHKDPSEIEMYQCDSCDFKTKHKHYLGMHMLRHKDLSDVTMYQCDSCDFKTKHKYYVNMHMLVHKDPSEITMYKCESCSFQAKRKKGLRGHMLIHHKHPSDIEMHQCESCPFRAKYKSALLSHKLTLKDPSEIEKYQCDSCDFKTERKQCLKRHMLLHKDSSEIEMYRCDSCDFKTKHKYYLNVHTMTIHKDPRYQCKSCPFKAKYRGSLLRHMLIHKNPSEITMHQCDFCSYKTKHKKDLIGHMVIHKDPSELTMYKCASCSFQTRHKRNLRSHMVTHSKSVISGGERKTSNTIKRKNMQKAGSKNIEDKLHESEIKQTQIL